ncbi:hypothetical protein NAT47_11715 [Flavobacterium sp. HXWNR69]|uniref:DUF4328 domain-containing protein n=1 Tax=Flavobacterium fragile TaxID=2949085 RepID=A0ABT0TJC5_9FLAO|nr:hypothetical protein [Flavobacterium sp. HXWNR69]MCL9771082.1 hypothetical protein [Flavobacterium sp. HXWNR69]
MDELELLKKDWKKQEGSFQQISEKEIYGMLHKGSSSIVKWILIISILEFIVLNGIGFFITDKEIENFQKLHPYLNIIEKFNYLILLGFIYLFYKNYQSICVLDSSKKLIKNIIKTRKIVNYYIYWNVFIGSFFGSFAFYDGFKEGYQKTNTNIEPLSDIGVLIIFIFSMLIVITLIFVFYKLLYGILLNRLNKNFNELKKIDY